MTTEGTDRRGYTLIELLMVVAIIGLLISLILPAVTDSREAARRATCANNLRQIGLGLHQFETSHGKLPGLWSGSVYQGRERTYWSYSPSGLIASTIGGENLTNDLADFRQPIDEIDTDWNRAPVPAPPTLHCPSDALASGRATSYRFSLGVIPSWPEDPGGAFARRTGLRLSAIRDGLSNTAFASERLVSLDGGGRPDLERDLLALPREGMTDTATDCVRANLEGRSGVDDPWSTAGSGLSWLSGSRLHASISFLFPPNSAWKDCVRLEYSNGALTTARSGHASGVNVLFGDGRVGFISDSIDLATWRGLATRAGGEVGFSE